MAEPLVYRERPCGDPQVLCPVISGYKDRERRQNKEREFQNAGTCAAPF